MNFREFYFDEDVRVCLYHVGKENLEFHKHTYVSDITYCANGVLLFDLPIISKSFVVSKGGMFQVPYDTIHRVSNYAEYSTSARYILVQIGKFDLDFIDAPFVENMKINLNDCYFNFYIGNKRRIINNILWKFKNKKIKDVEEQENSDIIKALELLLRRSLDKNHVNEKLLSQLNLL